MRYRRDERRGDECITREALAHHTFDVLRRLADFIGLDGPRAPSLLNRHRLIDALYSITRCGKTEKRRAA